MFKTLKKVSLTILALLLINNIANAQIDVDFARSMGKMYVVVAVILAAFIGIVLFLIYMERRISKMEKNLDEN
jgi:uncharacterized integral membrane protein